MYRNKTRIRILLLLLGVFLIGGTVWFIWHRERPYLTVIGAVKMADGIGRQAVELMLTFHGEKSMGFIPAHPSCLTDVPQKLLPLITHPNRRLGKVVILESSLPSASPKFFNRLNKLLKGPKHPHQIRIAYSMIESSRIPPEWAVALNHYFDAVAVPDPFLYSVYKESGVRIPIFVLPLGLEIDPYLQAPLKQHVHVPFRFFNVSSLIPRKNHIGLLEAFSQAFGKDPAVELHINYRYGSPEYIAQVEEKIASLHTSNIFLTHHAWNNQEYLDFLKQGDVLVSLAKGEGFSIQPREAMALGLPVIISDNTAHKTILQTGLACGVSCPQAEESYNMFLHCPCGVEYTADVTEAAKKMRDVYTHYTEYLAQAEMRRAWAAQYRFQNLKPLYASLIAPKKVELGKENSITEEGLVTDSLELYRKYRKLQKNRL